MRIQKETATVKEKKKPTGISTGFLKRGTHIIRLFFFLPDQG